MAPVERYIIFYGLSRNSLQNTSTADNTTTNLIVTDIRQGGTYLVGVAAMNSGGISIITYSQNIGTELYACSEAEVCPALSDVYILLNRICYIHVCTTASFSGHPQIVSGIV